MRLVNRPLAFILAAAVTVACVIVIIEVIAFHIKSGPLVLHWTTWYHWASRTRWNQLVVQVWSAILIVIGLLILALELKPRRITRLRLHSRDDAIDAGVTRAGLARSLRSAAPFPAPGAWGYAAPTWTRCPRPRSRSMGPRRSCTWKSVSAGRHPCPRSPGGSAGTSGIGSGN